MRNFIIPQFANAFKKGKITILKHFCFEKMSTVARSTAAKPDSNASQVQAQIVNKSANTSTDSHYKCKCK